MYYVTAITNELAQKKKEQSISMRYLYNEDNADFTCYSHAFVATGLPKCPQNHCRPITGTNRRKPKQNQNG